jgi:CRP-like cAMP-binding protein
MMPHNLLSALSQAPAIERKDHIPIFLQGEMPLGLWLLEAGELRISRISSRGRNVVLEILEPGDLAGLASAVGDIPYETGSETCGDSRLRLLARADLMRLLQSDPESYAAVASMLAREVAAAHRWIGRTTLTRSGAARIAYFLLNATAPELARLTQTELACRIGISRETVSRIVGDLRKSGALSPQQGAIRVQNREALEQIAAA